MENSIVHGKSDASDFPEVGEDAVLVGDTELRRQEFDFGRVALGGGFADGPGLREVNKHCVSTE
ncbi:hypothetical protein PG996_008987 [Apiospora saccharicola]|uniref:Uncharacterized protein n=1 Tax=Apiospora saccharicola TaxID=335842 RepID=A0ABR1UJG6_9PEZI